MFVMFAIKDWVAKDSWRFGGSVSKTRKGMVLLNPKGYGYVKTRKGLVTKRIGLTPRSEFLRVCLKPVVFGGVTTSTPWYFQICWDLQISSRLVCLHSGTLCSREPLCLLLVSGSCRHLDLLPCWRSIHSLKLNPTCFCKCLLFMFFVTWFRARTRVRWVAPVISEIL